MRNLMKKLLITAMPLALAMTLIVSPSAAASVQISAANCAVPIASKVLNDVKAALGKLTSNCTAAQQTVAANGNGCNTVKSTTTPASAVKTADACAKVNTVLRGKFKTGVCGTQDCAKGLDACKKALTGCFQKNAPNKCGTTTCLPGSGKPTTTAAPQSTTTAAPQTTTTAPQTTTAAPQTTTTAPQTTTTAPQTTTTAKPSTTTATTPSTTTAQTTTTPKADNLAFERRVVELVNEQRAANGLAPLTLNEKLANVARVKSQDMHDKNYFSHTSPTYGSPFDMMRSFGITYRSAGENIAMGYTTPEAVMEGWMNSPGHRANILNASFTQIGVGYVASGNYWTQEFIG